MFILNRNLVYLCGWIRIKLFILLLLFLIFFVLFIVDISFMYCRVYILYEYGCLLSVIWVYFVFDVNDDKGLCNLCYDIIFINNKNCSFYLIYEYFVIFYIILKIM